MSSWDGPGENTVCWLIQKVRYKNMAKSTLTLSGLSVSTLSVALLLALQSEGKEINADTLSEVFADASDELARQNNLTRCFDTRVKMLVVDFFASKKNSSYPSAAVIQHVSKVYTEKYESAAPDMIEAYADVSARVTDFFKRNTGSQRSETAKAKKAGTGEAVNSLAPSLETALMVSRGPSGVSLNQKHFDSMWASKTCLAYQELVAELEQVNNPIEDSADSDSEAELDSEAKLDSDADASESVLA